MKLILENWQEFLNEESEGFDHYKDQVEIDENGFAKLYHIGKTPGLSELDPNIAASMAQRYTQREYRSWERPRIFFFTREDQEDTAIGAIRGHKYVAQVPWNQLYPLFKDPLKFLAKEQEYKEWREEAKGTAQYYPVNKYEMVAHFANEEGYRGFIYPQSNKLDSIIVAMWDKVPVKSVE